MTSYRRHGRTPLECELKLEHHILGEVFAQIRDVSDTGVFVQCKELIGKIAIGDALKAQSCATPSEWGIPSQLTVVRLTDDGIGFAYE